MKNRESKMFSFALVPPEWWVETRLGGGHTTVFADRLTVQRVVARESTQTPRDTEYLSEGSKLNCGVKQREHAHER